MAKDLTPEFILRNGKITTLDDKRREATAIAMTAGKILATGSDAAIMQLANDNTRVIDLNKRRVIPGLNDSHTHLIRGGLNYNMELRWEGVPSVSLALAMLKRQAERTPAPQWVRVVGGWSEFQFAERRMPTLDEINKVAPDTPVFILHLYGQALLNQAAVKALGMDKQTQNPPGGKIARDSKGNPTGLLVAKPSALILYSTLSKGPSLPEEYQYNSSRHYMREMNRLGITSVIDAGGGGTDATRVASYNPFVSLYWMITGKTLGGLSLYDDENRLDRETALFLWTKGSSWFSGEDHAKGALQVGELADLAVLSGDLMQVDEEEIKNLHSVLTIMDGKIVHADAEFSPLNPSLPPAMPDWSPVNEFGGHYGLPQGAGSAGASMAIAKEVEKNAATGQCCSSGCGLHGHNHNIAWSNPIPVATNVKKAFWGALGCSCFAV